MTNSPDARTPSAELHTLTGSSRPGEAATMQPFQISASGTPAEMPDTFRRLSDAINDVVATCAGGMKHVAAGANPELAALVDEFEIKSREADTLIRAAADTDCDDIPGVSELTSRLSAIVARMYEVRAESDADLELVSRFLQLRWVQEDSKAAADLGHNLADDLLRLRARARTAELPRHDPFPDLFHRACNLRAAGNAAGDEAAADRAFDQLHAVEGQAMDTTPCSSEGIAACLEWVRAECLDFEDQEPDAGRRLMVALLDGALRALRPAAAVEETRAPRGDQALTAEWLRTSRAYFAALDLSAGTEGGHPQERRRDAAYVQAAAADLANRRKIAALRSTAPTALRLKAAAILAHVGGLGWMNQEIAKLGTAHELFEEGLALSLARDVIELLGAPVQALAEAAGLDVETVDAGYAQPRNVECAA